MARHGAARPTHGAVVFFGTSRSQMSTPTLNLDLTETLPQSSQSSQPAQAVAPPARPRAPRQHWLREPLLHFIVLGGLLFAADHFLSSKTDDSHTIVVGAEVDSEA